MSLPSICKSPTEPFPILPKLSCVVRWRRKRQGCDEHGSQLMLKHADAMEREKRSTKTHAQGADKQSTPSLCTGRASQLTQPAHHGAHRDFFQGKSVQYCPGSTQPAAALSLRKDPLPRRLPVPQSGRHLNMCLSRVSGLRRCSTRMGVFCRMSCRASGKRAEGRRGAWEAAVKNECCSRIPGGECRADAALWLKNE